MKTKVAILAGPGLADELRLRHVTVMGVIGSRSTLSGAAVYYLK